MKIKPEFTTHDLFDLILLVIIVLAACWVPAGKTAEVKYCENKVTGEIVTVKANMPCPYPTAEL